MASASIPTSSSRSERAPCGRLLIRAGVRRGERVLIVLPDTPPFAWVFFGTLARGAVVAMGNPDASPEQIDYLDRLHARDGGRHGPARRRRAQRAPQRRARRGRGSSLTPRRATTRKRQGTVRRPTPYLAARPRDSELARANRSPSTTTSPRSGSSRAAPPASPRRTSTRTATSSSTPRSTPRRPSATRRATSRSACRASSSATRPART